MADQTINDRTEVVSPGADDFLPIRSGGTTKKVKKQNLLPDVITPGSFTNSNITVDAKGRVIVAANGTGGGGSGGDVSLYLVSPTYGITLGTGLSSGVKQANWAALKLAKADAITAGKVLVLPLGTLECEMPSVGDNKITVTGNLEVSGYGRDLSTLKFGPDPATFAGWGFYCSAGTNTCFNNFTLAGPATVSTPTTSAAAQQTYGISHEGVNGLSGSLRIYNLKATGKFYEPFEFGSGSGGAGDMLIDIQNVDARGFIQVLACFSVNGETKRLHIKDSYFHDAGQAGGYFSDLPTTPYGHLVYKHGNVSTEFDNLRLDNNYYYAIQTYGSPTDPPKYERYLNVTIGSGCAQGILTSANNLAGAQIVNLISTASAKSIEVQNSAHIVNPNLVSTAAGTNVINAINSGTTLAADFQIIGGKITVDNGTCITCAYATSKWKIQGTTLNLNNSSGAATSSAINNILDQADVDIIGVTVNGPSTGTAASIGFALRKGRNSFSKCTLNGKINLGYDCQPGSAVLTELLIHDNVFNQSSGYAGLTDASNNGKIRHWNNSFPGVSATNHIRSTGYQHGRLTPGVNPSAIASAATVYFGVAYDAHHISGTTTINNFNIESSTGQGLAALSGVMVCVIFDSTAATSAAGNIKPKSVAARVANEAARFMYDAQIGFWYEM